MLSTVKLELYKFLSFKVMSNQIKNTSCMTNSCVQEHTINNIFKFMISIDSYLNLLQTYYQGLEYTIPNKGVRSHKNGCCGYDTKLNPVVKLQF